MKQFTSEIVGSVESIVFFFQPRPYHCICLMVSPHMTISENPAEIEFDVLEPTQCFTIAHVALDLTGCDFKDLSAYIETS